MADSTLDLAYEAVMASYDHVMDRLNALNAQMDQWVFISLSIVPLVPLTIMASDRPASLGCPLVIAGIGLVLSSSAYCSARLRGRAIPISPTSLTNEWLQMDPDDFQREMIHWRANHFERLMTAVDWKRNTTYVMFGGLAIEILGLSVWAFQQVGG